MVGAVAKWRRLGHLKGAATLSSSRLLPCGIFGQVWPDLPVSQERLEIQVFSRTVLVFLNMWAKLNRFSNQIWLTGYIAITLADRKELMIAVN